MRLVLGGLGLLMLAPVAITTSHWPVPIAATPVPLDPGDPDGNVVGQLVYRGGLSLKSTDRRFGGLSDLSVSADGSQLVAISDEGHWLRARLDYDERGHLRGMTAAQMGPLHDTLGRPLVHKENQDAESLTRLPDGSWLVAFEHRHRLWRYGVGDWPLEGAAEEMVSPPGLQNGPRNGGIESLATLADGRIIAVCEEWGENQQLFGWLGHEGRWSTLQYRPSGAPRPTAITLLPSGDILVVERAYSEATGVVVGLKRVDRNTIQPGAVLEGQSLAEIRSPLTADNFEGVATRTGPGGETLVYLLSDDNFNPRQRTLLLMFALHESVQSSHRTEH